MAEFKTRLRLLREERSITQDQLAERLGITKSAVSSWERGERFPRFEMLDELADYLDTDINYLNGSSDIRRPYPRMTEEEQDRISDPGLQVMELRSDEVALLSDYRRMSDYGKRLIRMIIDEDKKK